MVPLPEEFVAMGVIERIGGRWRLKAAAVEEFGAALGEPEVA